MLEIILPEILVFCAPVKRAMGSGSAGGKIRVAPLHPPRIREAEKKGATKSVTLEDASTGGAPTIAAKRRQKKTELPQHEKQFEWYGGGRPGIRESKKGPNCRGKEGAEEKKPTDVKSLRTLV